MSQLEGIGSYGKPPKDVDIEKFHGHIGEHHVASPTTPTLQKDHDQEEDHHHLHHHQHDYQSKKSISVLAKVKEKAKKWRHNLVNKKNNKQGSHDISNNSSNTTNTTTTPAWGVSLEDDDDDNYEVDDDEEDPEYFGAPMYESEMAPEGYKEAVSQHPRTITHPHVTVSDKHVIPTYITPTHIITTNPPQVEDKEVPPAAAPAVSKTITESVTEKLAPAYAKVSEATQLITSKIQNVTLPTTITPAKTDEISSTSSEHQWDKGVLVKEYLMQKLEPGDEEKALSEVISDVISPKTITGDTGVVEKVREAVSTMLGIETSTQSLPTTKTKKNTSQNVPLTTVNMSPHVPGSMVNMSQHIPRSTTPNMSPQNPAVLTPNMSPLIPVSTNAQEVTTEAKQERRLQTN